MLVAAVACGAASAQEWPPGCDGIRDARKVHACRIRIQTARLRDQVLQALRDPYSAVFSDEALYASDDPPAHALCGRLNSKNAFGGYVGTAGFISTTTGLVRLQASEPDGFGTLWAMFCTRPL